MYLSNWQLSTRIKCPGGNLMEQLSRGQLSCYRIFDTYDWHCRSSSSPSSSSSSSFGALLIYKYRFLLRQIDRSYTCESMIACVIEETSRVKIGTDYRIIWLVIVQGAIGTGAIVRSLNVKGTIWWMGQLSCYRIFYTYDWHGRPSSSSSSSSFLHPSL